MSNIKNHNLEKVSFNEILNSFPIPSYVWKKEGDDLVLIRYNIAADAIIGGKMYNYLGTKASEFLANRRPILNDLKACLDAQTSISRELEWCCEDMGEKRLLNARYNFIPPCYVLVNTVDITEQRKKELEYVITENALDSSINAVVLADFEGNVSYINNAGVKLWGCDNNRDILGRSMFLFWHDKSQAKSVLKAVIKKEHWSGQVLTVRHDGSPVYIQFAANLLKNKEGNPLCLMGSYIDISDRVEINEALKKTAEVLKGLELIVNQSPAVVILFNFDENWSVEFITENIDKFGYNQNLFHTQRLSFSSILPPEDHKELKQCIESMVIKGKDEFKKEFRIKSNSNEVFWVDCHFLMRKDNFGNAIQIQGIFLDITERKQFETHLKESEEKFRNIAEQSLMGIIIYQDGLIKYANKALTELFEYRLDEIVNLPINKFMERIHSDDRQLVLEKIKEKIDSHRIKLSRYNARFITRSGAVKYLEIISKRISYRGKPAIIATTIDLTKQKSIEKELIELNSELEKKVFERTNQLQESEQRYRHLFESSPFSIWLTTEDGTIINCNSTANQLFTIFDKTDIIGKNPIQIIELYREFLLEHKVNLLPIDENTIEKFLDHLNQLSRGIIPQPIEFYINRFDGIKMWLNVVSSIVHTDEGKVYQHIIQDVTETKITTQKIIDSEGKFREIFNSANDAIIIHDIENHKIVDFNVKLSEMFGYSREEVLNFSIDFIGENIILNKLDEMRRIFRKTFTEGPQIFEWEAKMKDGRFFWVEFNLRSTQVMGKNCVIAIIRDITQRKNIEQELRNTKENYEHIINNILDVITEIDENNRIKYISPNVIEVFGFTQEEVIDKCIFEFIHPDDIEPLKETFKGIKKGEGFSLELRVIRKDKTVRQLLSRGKFILKNNKDCIIGISRDITEEKELFKKYREAYFQADFYRDLFTHDMNNILSNLKGSIDLCYMYLHREINKEKADDTYSIIIEELDKGKCLISNIRKLSKLDNLQPKPFRINIYEVLDKAIDSIKAKHRSRIIIFSVQKDIKLFEALANEFLIDVFDNILNNAVRYNENQVVEIKVNAFRETSSIGDNVRLEFFDNGIGIKNDKKELIFKKGYLDQKKTKGMGIGLTLVKNIIESYHGKIWVEDKIPGDYRKGSKFVIVLPAA